MPCQASTTLQDFSVRSAMQGAGILVLSPGGAMSYQASVTLPDFSLQSAMQVCGSFTKEPFQNRSGFSVIHVDPQRLVIQLEKSTPHSLPELKCFRGKIFVTSSAVWSAHVLYQTE